MVPSASNGQLRQNWASGRKSFLRGRLKLSPSLILLIRPAKTSRQVLRKPHIGLVKRNVWRITLSQHFSLSEFAIGIGFVASDSDVEYTNNLDRSSLSVDLGWVLLRMLIFLFQNILFRNAFRKTRILSYIIHYQT